MSIPHGTVLRLAGGLISSALLLVACGGCSTRRTAGVIRIPEDDIRWLGPLATMVDLTVRDNRIVISGGSPLYLVARDCVRGSGLRVLILNRNGEAVFRAEQEEIYGGVIVDYSEARDGVFRWTACTWDPRAEDTVEFGREVPFFVFTVRVNEAGRCSEEGQVVLEAEEATADRVDDLCREIIACLRECNDCSREERWEEREKAWERAEDAMAHVRNVGIGEPDVALEAYTRVRAALGDELGCGSSELLSTFAREVETARDVASGVE